MKVQKQIGLRNRDVRIVKNKDTANKASTRKPKRIQPPKDASTNVADSKGKEKKEDNPRGSD